MPSSSVSMVLARSIDWLLPRRSVEASFHARFVALVGLVAAVTGLGTGLGVLIVAPNRDPAAFITLGYAVLVLVVLGALKAGAGPVPLFWALQVLTSLVFVGSRAVEAEVDWPLVTWLAVFPILGVLFGGWRPGVLGLGVAALSGAAMWFLEFHPVFAGVALSRAVSVVRGVSFTIALFAITLVFDALRARALQHAEQAAAARSLFLANMSHELRTPMNGVIGITELLLNERLPPEVHEQLQLLSRSGAQLVTLVNDILDLTRLESGRVELESVPTDVRAIVADVVALLRPTAAEKGLVLSSEVGVEVPQHLRGDPTRLRQIITNLLANAVKFTLRGQVTLRVLKKGTQLSVEIRDTGVGMPPVVQERLFRSFEQADASYTRRFGGSGLGLSISQRLVSQMNGSIHVESAEGLGSTFSFEIDCVPCAAPSNEVTPARGVRVQPRHVLVVDDNPINVHVLAAMLKLCGCTLVIARDGLEALAAIGREPFDLVLMDCHMPNLDGFEATRRIRAMAGAVARTRVVAVTASALSEELAECRAAGMDDTLTKPLTLRALQQTLERAGPSPDKS